MTGARSRAPLGLAVTQLAPDGHSARPVRIEPRDVLTCSPDSSPTRPDPSQTRTDPNRTEPNQTRTEPNPKPTGSSRLLRSRRPQEPTEAAMTQRKARSAQFGQHAIEGERSNWLHHAYVGRTLGGRSNARTLERGHRSRRSLRVRRLVKLEAASARSFRLLARATIFGSLCNIDHDNFSPARTLMSRLRQGRSLGQLTRADSSSLELLVWPSRRESSARSHLACKARPSLRPLAYALAGQARFNSAGSRSRSRVCCPVLLGVASLRAAPCSVAASSRPRGLTSVDPRPRCATEATKQRL